MNVSSIGSIASTSSVQKPVAPPPQQAQQAPAPAPANDGDADDKGGAAPAISHSVQSGLTSLKLGG